MTQIAATKFNFVIVFLCLKTIFLLTACQDNENIFTESVRIYGAKGIQPGFFNKPRAITIAHEQKIIYVVDITGRIQAFSSTGKFLHGFRTPKIEQGKPTGLGYSNGVLLVADTHYHRVLCYTPKGKLLFTFGEYGLKPEQFLYVTDVAASKQGHYYVTQYGGALSKFDRIQKFSSDGHFIKAWGKGGNGKGEFDRPMSMAIDDNENVYVADSCNHRIQKFDSNGKFLDVWGTPGIGVGQLSYPYGIAFTPDKKFLYVSEFGNNRIQKFTLDGESLGYFGIAGKYSGMFANPWDIEVGSQGEIYVVDALNHRVQCISPNVFTVK